MSFLNQRPVARQKFLQSRFGRAPHAGPPDPTATAAGLLLLQYKEEPHELTCNG